MCMCGLSNHWGALVLYKVLKSFNADEVVKVDWDGLHHFHQRYNSGKMFQESQVIRVGDGHEEKYTY